MNGEVLYLEETRKSYGGYKWSVDCIFDFQWELFDKSE